jgi:hypothetical protein
MRNRQARKIVKLHGRWVSVPFVINGVSSSGVEYFSVGKWSRNKWVLREVVMLLGAPFNYRFPEILIGE